MTRRHPFVVFTDCETTGNDDTLDEVVEIGLVVVAYPNLDEVFARSYLVAPSMTGWDRLMHNSVVRTMHERSGLIDALRSIVSIEAHTPEAIDQQIERDLAPYAPDGQRIPFAGSGVSHFDRRFIARFFPRFDRMVTYWAYDVGVIRRVFALAGITLPIMKTPKRHRALDDARHHVAEFREYLTYLTKEAMAARHG
jgi:oligoribonuclease (3'-5' exoribonuclease)